MGPGAELFARVNPPFCRVRATDSASCRRGTRTSEPPFSSRVPLGSQEAVDYLNADASRIAELRQLTKAVVTALDVLFNSSSAVGAASLPAQCWWAGHAHSWFLRRACSAMHLDLQGQTQICFSFFKNETEPCAAQWQIASRVISSNVDVLASDGQKLGADTFGLFLQGLVPALRALWPYTGTLSSERPKGEGRERVVRFV